MVHEISYNNGGRLRFINNKPHSRNRSHRCFLKYKPTELSEDRSPKRHGIANHDVAVERKLIKRHVQIT